MYNESGFGTGGSPYEYVVTPKMTPTLRMKKILFIALYISRLPMSIRFGVGN